MKETESFFSIMHVIERLIRGHDSLDESLHAGHYFWILVGTQRFLSMDMFIYPLFILCWCYFIPIILNHSTYVNDKNINKGNFTGSLAMFMVYLAAGFLCVILPKVVVLFYQINKMGASVTTELYNYAFSVESKVLQESNFCTLNPESQHEAGDQILQVISIFLVLIVFLMNGVFYQKIDHQLFQYYHWHLNIISIFAVMVIHYPFSLVIVLFIWPILANVQNVFGLRDKNVDRREWLIRSMLTVIFIILMLLILFGTFLLKDINKFDDLFTSNQLGKNFVNMKNVLLHGVIRDSQCSGSILWTEICTLFIPILLAFM